jgi:multidrug efflux pump subunit AcrA (membrane-fusion protein)
MSGNNTIATNGKVAAAPGTLPAARTDLVVLPKRARGTTHAWMVQHPENHSVFEFGQEEYFLFSRLDGRSTIEQVRAQYAERFGQPLAAEELETFVRQLGDQDLLQDWVARRAAFTEAFGRDDLLPVSHHQIAGARGDRLIAWIERRLRWVFTRPAQCVFVVTLVLAAAIAVVSFWDILEALVLQPKAPFMLGIVIVSACVNSARGFVHGIAHKHFGGQVPMIHVSLLAYVVPWVSCDYSGVRWIAKKSDRMWTIFSGIYFELLMWAVGLIAWKVTLPGVANSFWLLLALGAGGAAFLFTANPLVKLAGYWLLVTWLEIPRLRERALAALGAWLTRRPRAEILTPRERGWFIVYGALVIAYFVGYWGLIILFNWFALTGAFGGAGAIAGVLFAALLFHRPLAPVWGRMKPSGWSVVKNSKTRRRIVRVSILVVVIVALLLPYPYETGGPFIVIPAQHSETHGEVEGGRITRVFVKEGDRVTAGQRLGQIDRRPYERNLRVTQATLAEAESKLALMRKRVTLLDDPPNMETIQSLEAEIRRLRLQEQDFKEQLELTTLRAGIDGRVTTPLIEQGEGKYIKQGDLFATVERAESVQIEIQVPEADIPQVVRDARVKVVAWAYPYETFYGKVRDIGPIANTPAVAYGGKDAKFVRVVADIPNAEFRLKTQLTGYAKIKTGRIPVWLVLARLIARWFAVQFWYWLP